MTDWLSETGIPAVLQGRLFATLVTIALAILIRWLVIRAIHPRVEGPTAWYRARKTITYLITAIALLILGTIWAPGFRDIATFLGLLSAGVAIALADVLKNLAGWIYIVLRRPFGVGDRIEVDGQAGDVIDIRLFRFSILEIRNWVDADQSTGRIIHLPNAKVFQSAIANFTQGFEYVWHELPVLITFESDWERAEELFRQVLDEQAPDVEAIGAVDRIRRAGRAFLIHYTHLTPTVYLSVRDSGVLLTGRVLVPVRTRRAVDQAIWKGLLRAFAAEPSVALAYPTVRTYLPDPIKLEGER